MAWYGPGRFTVQFLDRDDTEVVWQGLGEELTKRRYDDGKVEIVITVVPCSDWYDIKLKEENNGTGGTADV